MKNIFILISIFVGLSLSAYAENINECKTDIYYGNGVWNEYEDADGSRSELESLIKDEIINGNTLLQAKYGKVKLAYNWGQGTTQDILETYYQLKEAGQLEGIGYFTAIAALTGRYDLVLNTLVFAELWEPFTKDWEQGNVDEMWNYHYYPESFKLGHRVLLVSHSQGNLYANRIYDTINPTEYKKYFANVQVASPASEVKAEKGSYVTLFGDLIINPIPNSMSPNAHGDLGQLKSAGHAFVEAYLDQQDPYDKIVSRIKAVLPTLDVELTQWDTEGEPTNKGTCEEKVKVKHRFDLAVDMPFDVYPFNLSKKLYQVNGKWVKASCGGKNILETWDGKKDNECWMIDNPRKEKIFKTNINAIKFYAQYRYTSPDTVKIHYGGYRAEVFYVTNSEFKISTSCDGYGSDMHSSWNSINSRTPEEHRLIFTVYNTPNKALQCNLDKSGKTKDDILYIKTTSKNTQLKHDTAPYLTYPDYFETKVEYTAYLK